MTPGPIISVQVLGKQWVVLNSLKASKDLLEKKSADTSNRPHFTVAGDLVGWGNVTPMLQYGDTHRKHRKFFGQHIGTNSSLVAYYSTQEAEARRFVLNVLEKPDDLMGHCRRYGADPHLRDWPRRSYFWQICCVIAVEDLAWL